MGNIRNSHNDGNTKKVNEGGAKDQQKKFSLHVHLTKPKLILLVSLAVLTIAAAFGFGAYLFNVLLQKDKDTNGNTSSITAEIDPNAKNFEVGKSDETPDDSEEGIVIPGFGEATIPANKTEVPILFQNPEANSGKYYLSFKLTLEDSGEVIYESKLVPPGQAITNVTLTRGLAAGEYKVRVDVQPYKMDSLEETNNANLATILHVK